MAGSGGESKDGAPRRLPKDQEVQYLSQVITVVLGLIALYGGIAVIVRSISSNDSGELTPTSIAAADTPSPSPTPLPAATSSARSTETFAPTSTPRPTVTPEPTATVVPPTATKVQATQGVTMETVPSQSAQPGQGLLSVSFADPTESISGIYVEVHSLELDALQVAIAGERVARDSTDSSGSVIFDLDPGEYVVLANLPGYSWGTLTTKKGMANVTVREDHSTKLSVRLGRLTVRIVEVDQVVSGQYVEVHTQTPDANGNPVPDERVARGSTDSGSISFRLTPGEYIVESNLQGDNWGDASGDPGEAGVVVTAGKETTVEVRLGRVAATVRHAGGTVAGGAYLELYTQVPDASGNPVPDERVARGSTDDDTGIWIADVTPGTYCIEFEGTPSCGWEVETGSIIEMEFTKSQE